MAVAPDYEGVATIGKRAPVTMLVVVALVAFAAGAAAGVLGWASASAPSAPSSPGVLFVVDGATGHTEPLDTGRWRIHLTEPGVLWFKDRPGRGSGRITADTLVDAWSTAFAGSPPYAALTVATGDGADRPAAVRLTHPRRTSEGSISFIATPDAGLTATAAAWISELTPASAGERGRVALYIDDAYSDGAGDLGECNAIGPGGGVGCFTREAPASRQ